MSGEQIGIFLTWVAIITLGPPFVFMIAMLWWLIIDLIRDSIKNRLPPWRA